MPDPGVRSALTSGRARWRRLLGMPLIAALALFAGAFALGRPTAAQAGPAKAAAFEARAATAIPRVARPGTNLLRNSDGIAGDTSVQGRYAVTIPGWQIQSGLPTVITVTGQTAVVLEPYGYTVVLINLKTRRRLR